MNEIFASDAVHPLEPLQKRNDRALPNGLQD